MAPFNTMQLHGPFLHSFPPSAWKLCQSAAVDPAGDDHGRAVSPIYIDGGGGREHR